MRVRGNRVVSRTFSLVRDPVKAPPSQAGAFMRSEWPRALQLTWCVCWIMPHKNGEASDSASGGLSEFKRGARVNLPVPILI
jgi:hypothetical protein